LEPGFASQGASARPSARDLILPASGPEVGSIPTAAGRLQADGVSVRCVSMPSWDSFDAQLRACRDQVLPPDVLARLAVEPGAVQGGHRWVGSGGDVPGMEGFGAPALAGALLREFGFTVHDVVLRARRLLAATRRGAKKRLMAWVF